MAGSSFGRNFTVTTCGESHGAALLAIVDGCPPQIPLDEAVLMEDLARRRPGSTAKGTPRREDDAVRIVSGVFNGMTTGTPIGLIIENAGQRSQDYDSIVDSYRPGHADYTYRRKYGVRDHRGGGRASARETAMRVAAGGIAKQVLRTLCQVSVAGAVMALGGIEAGCFDPRAARNNPYNFADPSRLGELDAFFSGLLEAHDSCGAVVEVRARGVPSGWGDPIFSRLDAVIAGAMMSINAVKGVEVGDGFALAAQRGSSARDEITPQGFLSNHAGGILGGISTGQEIRVRLALKPTSSILIPGRSVNFRGEPVELVTRGRHDPCVGIRAVPVAEAMLALCLVDAFLQDRAQCSGIDEGTRGFAVPGDGGDWA
ncbi:MAG: chorismate synthase [Succinivibrionaceae bacterium]|nr:chorismate synthase [Succinivibrionaceae bacterium]